jgi:hypothetical protein
MKLINFRCSKCDNEEEYFDDEVGQIGQTGMYCLAENHLIFVLCSKCKSTMNRFDFKNNSQRWKYCDAE